MGHVRRLQSGEMWGVTGPAAGGRGEIRSDSQRWMADTFSGSGGHYRRNNHRRAALVAPSAVVGTYAPAHHLDHTTTQFLLPAEPLWHFKPCMTEIYLYIDARTRSAG